MAKTFVRDLVVAVELGMIVPWVSVARRSWSSFVFDVSKRDVLVQNHRKEQ